MQNMKQIEGLNMVQRSNEDVGCFWLLGFPCPVTSSALRPRSRLWSFHFSMQTETKRRSLGSLDGQMCGIGRTVLDGSWVR